MITLFKKNGITLAEFFYGFSVVEIVYDFFAVPLIATPAVFKGTDISLVIFYNG